MPNLINLTNHTCNSIPHDTLQVGRDFRLCVNIIILLKLDRNKAKFHSSVSGGGSPVKRDQKHGSHERPQVFWFRPE